MGQVAGYQSRRHRLYPDAGKRSRCGLSADKVFSGYPIKRPDAIEATQHLRDLRAVAFSHLGPLWRRWMKRSGRWHQPTVRRGRDSSGFRQFLLKAGEASRRFAQVGVRILRRTGENIAGWWRFRSRAILEPEREAQGRRLIPTRWFDRKHRRAHARLGSLAVFYSVRL